MITIIITMLSTIIIILIIIISTDAHNSCNENYNNNPMRDANTLTKILYRKGVFIYACNFVMEQYSYF